jgi:ketosteroid isomerase-like protein
MVLLPLTATKVSAQWATTWEQFYLQASHNWTFRGHYAGADRLFNAFDYGHAILYEILWTKPNAPATLLEEKEFDFLTRQVLVKPPRVPLEEGAIEVRYAQLAPEAKVMFEWAHILHRQIYDVLADERLDDQRKDAEVARLVAYYQTRPDVAFSTKPKSMKLMQEQPYSLAFRQKYPKFNGLIWAYHWMQVGLYEPLITGRNSDERQAGVRSTVARFWQMLGDPPRTFPYQMPMTAAIAPVFAARYPEAAIIFDNLHSMHDVISDILANPGVARDRKRAEILRAARLFRDDTSYVMPVAAWLAMAGQMGVENMGGPSVGYLPELPTPTVTYGAVMTHDDRTGEMTGFKYGGAAGGEHAGHAMPAAGHVAQGARGENQGADSAAVVGVVARFHEALERGDSAAALALLAPDAVILESGGAETVSEYRAHHLPADIDFARAIRSVRTSLRVTVQGDLAWAAATSTTQGEFRGRAVNSAGAELMVLRRTSDGWRIAAIHWSSRRRTP